MASVERPAIGPLLHYAIRDELADVGVVVHCGDAQPRKVIARHRVPAQNRRLGVVVRGRAWQKERDAGPFAHRRAQAQCPARFGCHAERHAEPQSGAGANVLGREEGLQRARDDLGRHTRPGVLHAQLDIGTGRQIYIAAVQRDAAGCDPQRPALRHRIAPVDGKVQHGQFELRSVAANVAQLGFEHELAVDERSHARPDEFLHSHDQAVHFKRLQLEPLGSRKGEELLRQFGPARHALSCIVGPSCDLSRIARLRSNQVEIAPHRLKQIVEIVRDTPGELPDRIHLLRLQERGLRPFALRDLRLQLRKRRVAR
jgi:hypothetical protein